MRFATVGFGALAILASAIQRPALAQTGAAPAATRTPEEMRASFDARKGDFDYLLGDWEFTAENKEYGKLRGFWSAVKIREGQILDEYRVVDGLGATVYVTTTVRNYNSAADRWELVGLDAGNGLQDVGTGRKVGSEIHIEQRFGVTSPQPASWKIRYFNIAPDRFSWAADRSTDGGKTWVTNHQTIEARRIGPSRSLGPLSGPRAVAASPDSTDPVTGSWGFGEVTYLQLKFDGSKSVTGEAIWHADGKEQARTPIKVGTFDAGTGALRLEGDARTPDGQAARFVIEGTLAAGTFTGVYRLGENRGNFSFTRR